MLEKFIRMSDAHYEGSAGPYCNRNVYLDDLWPQGTAMGKDTLKSGDHPVLGVGDRTDLDVRENAVVGVVLTYDANAKRAVLNIAPGYVTKQWVCNITAYSQGSPSSYADEVSIGQPVYLDDSADLATGVTLSLSPLNEAGLPNPKVGNVWYDQTEDQDIGIGGGRTNPFPKEFEDDNKASYLLLNVIFWPGTYQFVQR